MSAGQDSTTESGGPRPPSRSRAWLVNALRVGVSAACIALTVKLIDWRAFWTVLSRVDLSMTALLAPCLIVGILVPAWRWRTLLRANGFEVGFGRAFALTYVGVFFSQFLPGVVGGDIARMVLAAKNEERKAAAAGTVFLDRVIGLAAMACMACAAVIPLARDARLRVPVLSVVAVLAALVVGYFVYFSRLLRESRTGVWVKGRLPSSVRDIDGVLKSVRRSPRLLAVAIAQSLCSQICIVLVAYGLSRALGIRVALLPFLLFEVLIFILTAVPISMGGWGVQEVAYAQLFATVGVPTDQAVALSVLMRLCLIAVSLPGGVLFAVGAHRPRA